MPESTNKKIHKLQIYKETYDIDVKKDLNESNPSSVAYVYNRTHYLNNPLVIALPYKTFNEWSYSLTFDSHLESEKDYVIQFELTNNTGALISKVFKCDDSLTFSYLNKTTNEEENLKLVITADTITLEASDSLKQQLSTEPLKINIIKASDITKLPNSFLNIDFAPNEDKNEALLATKASIDAINSKHEADVAELQKADEANLKEAKQYTDDNQDWEHVKILLGKDSTEPSWIITKDFGYFTIDPKTGQRKITMEDFSPEDPEALSVSLKELFSKAYSQDKMPEIISPTIKFEGKNFGEYEVGKTVTPGYRFYNANPGSYSFGPETGVAWKDFEATITGTHNKNSYTSTENATESDQIIYFDEIVVLDDTNLTISGKATHTAGVEPKTALENTAPDLKITEATKSYNYSPGLTGYRKLFFGSLPAKYSSTDLISEIIRGLSTYKKAKTYENLNVEHPVGASCTIFAVPEGFTVSKVLDKNASDADVTSAFKYLCKVPVADASGNNNYIDYDVWYTEYAKPNDTANIYKVTVIKQKYEGGN